MRKGICELSCIPLRSNADEKSEMVSQVLFGEKYIILEHSSKFSRIKLLNDNYTGWISNNMVHFLEVPEENQSKESVVVNTELYSKARRKSDNQVLIIPGASSLYDFDEKNDSFSVNLKTYLIEENKSHYPGQNIFDLAKQYLNSPYLWGGRTFLGIDCSGLVQNVFKMKNILLPRDAHQQCKNGVSIEKLTDVQKGDLAFFNNMDGKVVHVGILDGNGSIIHSSGNVKIELISEEGIIKKETNEITHQLHSIRRIS